MTKFQKSVDEIISQYDKLQKENESLREKVAKLKAEQVSEQVKKTNTELRAENRMLKAKLKTILNAAHIEVKE